MAAPSFSPETTKRSVQHIKNVSFDEEFRLNAVELWGYDSGNGVMRPISVDSNGVVQTNASGIYAPIGATFITQTPSASLTNEQALSGLATGYMKVTTSTGVVSSQAVPIPVSDGGSGLTTLTTNRIPYGNGTSAFQSSANLTYDGTSFLVGGTSNLSATAAQAYRNANTSSTARALGGWLDITADGAASFHQAVVGRAQVNVTSSSTGLFYIAGLVGDLRVSSTNTANIADAAWGGDFFAQYNGSGGAGTFVGGRFIADVAGGSGTISNLGGGQFSITSSNLGSAGPTISAARVLRFVTTVGTNQTYVSWMGLDIENATGSGTITTGYAIRIRNQAKPGTPYGIYFDGTGTGNGVNWGTTTLIYSSAAGAVNVTGTLTGSSSIAATTTVTAPTSVITPLVSPASGTMVVRGLDSIGTGTGLTLRGGDSSGSGAAGGNVVVRAGVPGAMGGVAGSIFFYETDGTTEILKMDNTGAGWFGATPVGRSSAYTPTNVTTDRSYDANATTTDELADVLGTLIADLQATGIIG